MPGRNVFTVLQETAAQFGNGAALHQPQGGEGRGAHRSYSWQEWLQISTEVALGLVALGLTKGDIACLLSETRCEFYLADLAIMAAGGVSAALYTSYPMSELVQNIKSANPRFLFVENAKTLAALTEAAEAARIGLPQHVILMTGSERGSPSLESLREMGRALRQREPAVMERVQADISPQDGAILYLSSGATGEPKMGITSHAAVLANLDMGPAVLPIGPADCTIAFLPSAHIAQRIVVELLPMRMGTPVWFSESLARLPVELKTIRPTFLLAPPRFWEKMCFAIQSEVKKRGLPVLKLFHAALALGSKAAHHPQAQTPLPLWLKWSSRLAHKFVFGKVRERLGGRLRIAASGGAPLGKQLAEFYSAIGIGLIEGYGLTEAGIVSFNPLDRPKAGSIGKMLPGVEARLAADGELLLRAPCLFQGYYHDKAATRAVLDENGWFSTGDIAEMDSDGYWYITGRKKELIVSSNGKKIYPSRIENLFKMEPLINQAVLIGDKKPYVTALLTLNSKLTAAAKNEPAMKEVREAVSRVNQNLADFERIRRFKVLERDLTIEQGELTPTMKIRRSRVLENHRKLVSALYLEREESE